MREETPNNRPRAQLRVWPEQRRLALWAALLISGPLGILVATALNLWILTPLSLVPVGLGLRLIGWVEIDDDHLVHHCIVGQTTSIEFSQVREIGLGMRHDSAKKWWFPEVELVNGSSVKFSILKSRSGKQAVVAVEEIFAACMERMPSESEDQFTTVTESDDGELEFFLSPGYDAYLREKAENPQSVIPKPVKPAPQPVQRRPALSREPQTVHGDFSPVSRAEEAPEVFTPRALISREAKAEGDAVWQAFAQAAATAEQPKTQRGLDALPAKLRTAPQASPPETQSVETQPTETHPVEAFPDEVSSTSAVLTTAPAELAVALPPVVIEHPAEPQPATDGDRHFTSLFRRM